MSDDPKWTTGQAVAVHTQRGVYASTIKRITPTGIIVVDAGNSDTKFNPDGYERCSPKCYNRDHITPMTAEIREKIAHDRAAARLLNAMLKANPRRWSIQEIADVQMAIDAVTRRLAMLSKDEA